MSEAKEVIVEGETYEQAVAKALKLLNSTKNKVDITVISQQKTGFLGFGKKPIAIRVVKKSNLNIMLDEVLDLGDGQGLEKEVKVGLPRDSAVTDRFAKESFTKESYAKEVVPKDGWAAIQQGAIIVKNPEPGGRFPVIYPAKDSQIIVNGVPINEPTVVSSEDLVLIETAASQAKQSIDIMISQDKLTAYLIIQREGCQHLNIEDAPETQVLKPRVTTARVIWPEPPSLVEIEEKLEQSGIRYGLDRTAIESALSNLESPETKVIIARGKPPVDASGGEITYKINQASPTKNLNPYGEGLIDSVEAGAVLAVKNGQVYTETGMDVYGVEIPDRGSRNVELIAREGAKVIRDGTVVVAAITGRVIVDGKDKNIFSVVPVYTVNGDVDINVGNLKFYGDIVVLGNVLDGFRLEAGGDINVYGNVIHAELSAGRNITIGKNIISSVIKAGGDALIYSLLEPLLKELNIKLGQLITTVEQLKKHPSFSVADLSDGDGRLIQLLIDSRYQVITKMVVKLKEVLTQYATLNQSFHKVIENLNNKFYGLGSLRIKEIKELKVISPEIEGLLVEISDLLTIPANIQAEYVQNSSLWASGDIYITGAGSIISELTAGKNINIYSERGVVRGGQLSAHGLIKLKEVGTNTEAVVTITLIGQSKLEADLIHPVVVLQHGNQKHRFATWPVRYVEAYENKEGQLIVNSLKGKEKQ